MLHKFFTDWGKLWVNKLQLKISLSMAERFQSNKTWLLLWLSNFLMMVSRKVFCGATWPLRTGILPAAVAAELSETSGLLSTTTTTARRSEVPKPKRREEWSQSFTEMLKWAAAPKRRREWGEFWKRRRAGCFHARVPRLRKRGVGHRTTCPVKVPSGSHTGWSAAELSSCASVRSRQAEWTRSVVWAIFEGLRAFCLPPSACLFLCFFLNPSQAERVWLRKK